MALYYFDSSAIIKRYLSEVGTTWVINITDPMASNFIYLARITGVEVVSAITRQARASVISATDASNAITRFQYDLLRQYRVVELTPGVANRAMALAQAHALRGYDAVQLATSLEVNALNLTMGLPALTLISSDIALNNAAIAEGLIVDDPNAHP